LQTPVTNQADDYSANVNWIIQNSERILIIKSSFTEPRFICMNDNYNAFNTT
jgi:hypothetical protein